ncbi:MAG TPA: dihydroneopterin aldolase [Cyanobacteria bacterium UBA8530]|nr:dihydroneopterin aldolase [Cyanobacteria bacterium UBA8530]
MTSCPPFGWPRSAMRSSGGKVSDRILLPGIEAWGHHGLSLSERQLPLKLQVDLEVETDLRKAGESDEMEAAVDYVRLAEIARAVIEEGNQKLLEAIAEEIARRILEDGRIEKVRVRVGKTLVPVAGFNGPVFIEITRER